MHKSPFAPRSVAYGEVYPVWPSQVNPFFKIMKSYGSVEYGPPILHFCLIEYPIAFLQICIFMPEYIQIMSI
jgi:hypothetical protein